MPSEDPRRQLRNSSAVLLAVVITVLLLLLIAWARGPAHYRGDEVGATAAAAFRIDLA